jgi:hypothetical protein
MVPALVHLAASWRLWPRAHGSSVRHPHEHRCWCAGVWYGGGSPGKRALAGEGMWLS